MAILLLVRVCPGLKNGRLRSSFLVAQHLYVMGAFDEAEWD
jgi:hypothetical protein